jgi:hypothetical protein
MEEARYSFNVRFNLNGYDSQFTMRSDETWLKCLQEGQQALRQLAGIGAKPDRRWESVKNGDNGHQPAQPVKRECPMCHKDDQIQLITFTRDGGQISKLKCIRCNKWLPGKMQPDEAEVEKLLASQANLW